MNMQCNSTSYSPRRGGESHTTSSNAMQVSPIQQVGVSQEAAPPTSRRQIQVRSSIDADIGTSHSNILKYQMLNRCSFVNLTHTAH